MKEIIMQNGLQMAIMYRYFLVWNFTLYLGETDEYLGANEIASNTAKVAPEDALNVSIWLPNRLSMGRASR